MSNTVLQDRKSGPDWPLGFVDVATPGTPVRLTVNVDPSNVNAPETGQSNQYGAVVTGDEYTPRFQQLMVQAMKPAGGVSHGMVPTTGNVYLLRYASAGAGSGNRDDPGVMVKILLPGETFFLASAPLVKDVWSPYRYALDVDNANDGALVTGLMF